MTIVKEVTDDKKKSKAERKLLQIEHAKNASFGARAVKYGDKIANINDIFRDSPWYERNFHFIFDKMNNIWFLFISSFWCIVSTLHF